MQIPIRCRVLYILIAWLSRQTHNGHSLQFSHTGDVDYWINILTEYKQRELLQIREGICWQDFQVSQLQGLFFLFPGYSNLYL